MVSGNVTKKCKIGDMVQFERQSAFVVGVSEEDKTTVSISPPFVLDGVIRSVVSIADIKVVPSSMVSR